MGKSDAVNDSKSSSQHYRIIGWYHSIHVCVEDSFVAAKGRRKTKNHKCVWEAAAFCTDFLEAFPGTLRNKWGKNRVALKTIERISQPPNTCPSLSESKAIRIKQQKGQKSESKSKWAWLSCSPWGWGRDFPLLVLVDWLIRMQNCILIVSKTTWFSLFWLYFCPSFRPLKEYSE